MAFKTYVLLDRMNPTAPIFQKISKDQRVKIDKLPSYRPYLQVSYTDEHGENKTIRYKQNANSIFQSEQIEKQKMLANEKFTTRERRAPEFQNAFLMTNEIILQKYLDAYPGNKNFKGECPDVPQPEFQEYVKSADIKIANSLTKKQLKAGTKIIELDWDGAKEMAFRLLGASFTPPNSGNKEDDLEEIQNILIEEMNEMDEKGLDEILKESLTIDDKTNVFIGKLLTAKLISFDQIEGQVAKPKGDGWIALKDIPAEVEADEKKRLFGNFITSDSGQPYFEELNNDLVKFEEEKKAQAKAAKDKAKKEKGDANK